MKTMTTKLMAVLLAVLMCVCLVDTHSFADNGSNEPVYESDGLTYTFTLQGSWNSGYNASIRIDNNTNASIEDWKFEMVYDGSISNIWNAMIESNADGKYIIKNAGWNQDIAAGGYVEFGLSGAEAFDKYPSSYKMLTGITENSSEDFNAVFEITNDWIQGFTGRITITNNTDAVIEDWVLEFDGENDISTLWDGEIVSHEGTHYIVKSAAYNQNIPAGGSVAFNFNVDFRTSDAEFTNFALKSYADLSQTNPGGSDIEEPGTFDDIGEAYFKEPTAADIVEDDELGIRYVRNQLLVSAFMGLDKSVMEDICEEIGATIVGYIALTSDFQIEFNDDMTLEDLSIMADYLNSYSFVSNVTLNMSYHLQEEVTTTNDALYNDGDSWDESNPSGDTWALATLKVLSAWDKKDSFASVKVGVYDWGFAESHEDLIYAGLENNPSVDEKKNHGTHVAGIIAALHNNGKGISGVATKTQLYAYGCGNTSEGSAMGEKMAYTKLVGNHVKVINVSMGVGDEVTYAASHPEYDTATNKYSQKARDYINAIAEDQTEFFKKLISAGYDFVICNSAGNTNDDQFISDSTATYGVRKATPSELADSNVAKLPSGGVEAQYNSVLSAITDSTLKERIIVVGSLTKYNSLAGYSDIGSRVDVVAPGNSILSTYPTASKASGYETCSGTSMASPHIAGVVALMYQANPGIRASSVKRILKASSSGSVSDGTYSFPIPDASRCIVAVGTNSSSSGNDIKWPSGTLAGETKYNNDPLTNVSFSAYRKSSGEYNVGTYDAGVYSFTFNSDSKGDFVTVLPQGVYDITVYKQGYLPFCIQDVTINPDQTTYLGTVTITKWSHPYPVNGTSVKGVVENAITGTAESGVSVKFRKGWNNVSGIYATDIYGTTRAATSDYTGEFSCNLAVGMYTAELTKDGFVTGYYNVVSTDNSGTIPNKYTMVISPVLDSNEYRIVLTWGAAPRDLDSHLTFYSNKQLTNHVYYRNKIATYQGITIAELDLDDTNSYGPETVTITLNGDYIKDGDYFSYSVHDFTNRGSTDSTALSMSDAVVHVYAGNELVETYVVHKNQPGTVWHVFDIYEDGIHTVNDFYYEATPNNVR